MHFQIRWLQVCAETTPPTDPKGINWMFRAGIDNFDTRAQIIWAFQELGLTSIGSTYNTATVWTKTGNARQFHAMLGSKNGSGCAWFLINHKGPLGIKDITEVRIWNPGQVFQIPVGTAGGPLPDFTNLKPTMVFKVVDVAEPD